MFNKSLDIPPLPTNKDLILPFWSRQSYSAVFLVSVTVLTQIAAMQQLLFDAIETENVPEKNQHSKLSAPMKNFESFSPSDLILEMIL